MNTPDDATLNVARAALLARAAELRDRLQRVRADLQREREPLPRDFADAAMMTENDEVLEAIESTAHAELAHVERALTRLDLGTFGHCENCGAFIGAARLKAVPYATRCAACEARA
jgi:DnaK suppressor protein